MRKISFLLPLFSLIVFPAQNIIENPKKPLKTNSGRVIEAQEVLRIEDKMGEYFFRMPHNIKIGQRGEILVQDNKQLLLFDKNGRFICNLFKEGQGPGEMLSMTNYQLTPDYIIIHANPPKVMKLNYRGNLIEEIPIRSNERLSSFEFYYKGKYYFIKTDWTKLAGHEKIINIPKKLLCYVENGNNLSTLADFPNRYFIAQLAGERAIIQVDRFITTHWLERFLAVSHTPKYLIKIFDAERGEVFHSLRRNYRRAKAPKPDIEKQPRISIGGKTYTKPVKGYEDDILGMTVSGDDLWVLTSTKFEKTGILVDVFNLKGEYIDSFIIKFDECFPQIIRERYQLTAYKSHFFAVIINKKDQYCLVKFAIDLKS